MTSPASPPRSSPSPSREAKHPHSTTLAGCALALAIGAGVAGVHPFSFSADDAGSADTRGSSAAATAASASGGTDGAAAALPSAPADPELAETVRTATGAQRWLTMLAAVEKAAAEDMPSLLRAAGEDPAMLRMLATRWAELDPQHMLRWIFTESHLPEESRDRLPGRWILPNALFDEWTKRDLPAAVKALTDIPAFPSRESLRMTVANQVMKLDVERGLRVMKEWNIRNYLPDLKQVGEWAARDSRRAAEAVADFGGELIEREAMKEVGKAWAQSDPQAGLEFAATLAPSSRATLASEVIRGWAKTDLGAAVNFASAQVDPAFRASLAQGLVEEWAKADAEGALAWSQENLRGTARAEVIGGLIKAAAEKNLEGAAELVAGMEAGPAQNRACASIFETWFKKGKESRDAAFEWLAALPDAATRAAALERVQWDWMWREPDAVREFVSGPHGHIASPSLLNNVARSQTSKNPEAAMQWAASLPADRAGDVRRAVLESWLQVRPEGAMNHARTLPAGAEREDAIRTVSQTLVWQSPQQLAGWLRQLPRGDQKIAREILARTQLGDEHRRQIEQALTVQ